jgi:hypothetical protein
VPSGFKEIKISDAILVPGKCVLAFDRRYAPKSPFKGPYPTDEIRASVDFFIQVDIFSIATAIKKMDFRQLIKMQIEFAKSLMDLNRIWT